MNVLKIAAFAYGNKGGNPAGVVFCDKMPTEKEMLKIAKQVGYSETAFLKPVKVTGETRYITEINADKSGEETCEEHFKSEN